MLFSRLKQLFSRSETPKRAVGSSEQDFALLHHRFKLFLTAWNKFQETMTELEYTLCCDHPFGSYRVRALCTRVATQVFQCIQQLEKLSPASTPELYKRFGELQAIVAAEVYEDEEAQPGPLMLPLGHPDLEAMPHLADPSTIRLGQLGRTLAAHVPPGFVMTAPGCMRVFKRKELQEEFSRRVQASGGYATEHLAELSESLRELVESMPLPEDVAEAFLEGVRQLRAQCPQEGMQLLLRGRLWPGPEVGGEGDPGLLIWGPPVSLHASDDEVLAAFHTTLARKQQAQSLIYRRARGLTDSGAGVCVACMAVEEGGVGGIAHSANPLAVSGNLHIYACPGLPQDMEYSLLPVDSVHVSRAEPHEITSRRLYDPAHPVLDDNALRQLADLSVKLERLLEKPQAFTWLRTPKGDFYLLQLRDIIYVPASPLHDVLHEERDQLPPSLLSGGETASRGCVYGRVLVADSWEDARHIRKGDILVVRRDIYRWVSLIDVAAGIVAEEGLMGSRLASLAREFGRPMIINVGKASRMLHTGDMVTLCADGGVVFPGQVECLLDKAPPPHDYMPGSPVMHSLQKAAEHILPLTHDVDSIEFRAANCQTYHDIARYCHEKAVSAMFSLGSDKKHAAVRVKQLRDKVLKQFWVVNLNDGFRVQRNEPYIDIEEIASLPMLFVWYGMNAYPWQGPPPVDGKGFLSVLFEATANPNLDPATQTSYFSEKNYFLVSRDYCSLHSRFGFHFVSVEARLGERRSENYLVFQLRGGAANIERRILRVRFVADILWEFGLSPVVRNDALVARVDGMDMEEGRCLLAVAGYLTIHTRQLDMIMQEPAKVEATRASILADCRALYTGRGLPEGLEAPACAVSFAPTAEDTENEETKKESAS